MGAVIEIDGQRFAVLKFTEEPWRDTTISSALLRVTRTELTAIRELLAKEKVEIRPTPDSEPVVVRWGGALNWSRHEDLGDVFYKQIVRFLPADIPRDSGGLATAFDLATLRTCVLSLMTRMDALVDTLGSNGTLKEAEKASLTNDAWRGLVSEARRGELTWRLEEFSDAERLFD